MPLNETRERAAVDAKNAGNRAMGDLLTQQLPDYLFFAGELRLLSITAGRPAKPLALGPAHGP